MKWTKISNEIKAMSEKKTQKLIVVQEDQEDENK